MVKSTYDELIDKFGVPKVTLYLYQKLLYIETFETTVGYHSDWKYQEGNI